MLPLSEMTWTPCYRIIPSRFPPVDLFRHVAPPEDWMALGQIDNLTNDRQRQEQGEISLVLTEDRLSKPGSSLIMAPFTHPDPTGDHFTDGTFGVCHVAETFEEALLTSVKRREDFLGRTKEGPIELQMRVLVMDLQGIFHDLRGKVANDYLERSAAQALGCKLREQGSFGVICEAPICAGGTSIVVFRPIVLSNCRQERHLAYQWDGQRIRKAYDYSTGLNIAL